MSMVLICGGRELDHHAVAAWLEDNREGPYLRDATIILHGKARGADRGAGLFAKRRGITCLAYPAKWKKFGKAAGPIRNQQMLDEGKPDRVIAFPGGDGTADMVARALDADIPVHHVEML